MSTVLKVTYHPTKTEKLHFFTAMPRPGLDLLKKEMERRLFDERNIAPCEFQLFWIDEDNDEIIISNNDDYHQYYVAKVMSKSRSHIHVAPVATSNDAEATDQKDSASMNHDSLYKFWHKEIICKSCSVKPIIGFRYKCLQCPDYDLCERCESQHFHAEHLMMRIPSDETQLAKSFISNIRGSGTSSVAAFAGNDGFTFPPEGGATAVRSKNEGKNKQHRNLSELFSQLSNVTISKENSANNTEECTTEAASSQTTESRPPSEKQSESITKKGKPQAEGTACGNTVPPPSGTPDSSTDSKPKEEASPEKYPLTPDEIVDILPTIDSQYIKAGIKILSNFNEMFAKIFDPEDGVYAASSPAKGKNANLATAQPTPTKEQSIEVLGAAEDQPQVEASISKLTSISSVGSDGRCSQTEETDWQLLDKPHASLSTSVASAGARSIEEVNIVASTDAGATNAVGAAPDITKNTITVTPTPPPPNNRPVEVASAAEPRTESPPQQMDPPMTTTYHPVAHINNSIVTMMAMGFSNEGGWLTRLLESVNGNIPEAVNLLHSSRE